jgi:magnesium-transporting ATPase (P-type)
MAWTFEGGIGFQCTIPTGILPAEEDEDGKLETVTYSSFVGWITFVVILILIGLNVAFFIYMNFSRKLKYDDQWQQWKDKDSRRIHYRLVLGFSAGVSLLLTNLMISNFLGRKRYNAQFDSKHNFYRPLQYASIAIIAFVYFPMILVNLAALSTYQWGS